MRRRDFILALSVMGVSTAPTRAQAGHADGQNARIESRWADQLPAVDAGRVPNLALPPSILARADEVIE